MSIKQLRLSLHSFAILSVSALGSGGFLQAYPQLFNTLRCCSYHVFDNVFLCWAGRARIETSGLPARVECIHTFSGIENRTWLLSNVEQPLFQTLSTLESKLRRTFRKNFQGWQPTEQLVGMRQQDKCPQSSLLLNFWCVSLARKSVLLWNLQFVRTHVLLVLGDGVAKWSQPNSVSNILDSLLIPFAGGISQVESIGEFEPSSTALSTAVCPFLGCAYPAPQHVCLYSFF